MAGGKLVLFNKPYGVLCQFTDTEGRRTLADYLSLPRVRPAGRLDFDSEGLVVLTDLGWLQALVAEPRYKLWKVYWVQVEGLPGEEALERLRQGVELNDGLTRPAKVKRIDPPAVEERIPPVRFRKSVPTEWLELSIAEGRKRQVRRMTAAVGYPTLRLVRWQVGLWDLSGLAQGQWREAPAPDSREEYLRMAGPYIT